MTTKAPLIADRAIRVPPIWDSPTTTLTRTLVTHYYLGAGVDITLTTRAGLLSLRGTQDAVSTGVTITDAAGIASLRSATDAVSAGVLITDVAGVIVLAGSAETVSIGVLITDTAGSLALRGTLDTVTATSGTTTTILDVAGVLTLISARNCIRAASPVTRPSTGSVYRPDSGLACRP